MRYGPRSLRIPIAGKTTVEAAITTDIIAHILERGAAFENADALQIYRRAVGAGVARGDITARALPAVREGIARRLRSSAEAAAARSQNLHASSYLQRREAMWCLKCFGPLVLAEDSVCTRRPGSRTFTQCVRAE